MIDCKQINELVQKELDNDLNSADFLFLEKHCSSCISCQQKRNELWDIKYQLESLPHLDPGENFANNIFQTLEKTPVTKRFFNENALATSAAFCTLFFVLGLSLFTLLIVLSLALPFISLYNTWIGTVISNIAYWFSYFFNVLLNIKNALNIFAPSLLTLLLISLFSFILLIILMIPRRNIGYENN